MSIQFPDTPTEGQTFTASNGVIYTYEDGGWKANAVSGLDDSYVNRTGDTMTGDLTVPNLISEGDVQTTSLNGGPLGGFRNQIINGSHRVAQRGSTGTITTSGYTTDRWFVYPRTAGHTITWNVNANTTFETDVPEVSSFLQLQSLPGENGWTLEQRIELSTGSASSAPFVEDSEWTLSFWAWNQLSHNILPVIYLYDLTTDTSSDGVAPSQPSATMPTGTWTKYVFNYKLNWTNIPANFNCLRVKFNGPGDNQQSNTLLSNFQLEPGPVATPFEHRPIGTELALCQRYYQQFSANGLPWLNSGTPAGEPTYINVKLSTPMRTAAVTSDFTHISYEGVGNSTSVQVPITSIQNYAHRGTVLMYVPTSSETPNQIRMLNGVGDGSNRKGIGSFDAEL